ncbi:MAG: hypothetical protein AVO35_04225 [Candidatus Aegiribacteria sp. MLS_C]|nr:MAG: hypothetical protein AVO35_04225 [Candidatus Aegiribacteria sp. MLS_C]
MYPASLLALLVLRIIGIIVTGPSGEPVPGASVLQGHNLVGITDSLGSVNLPDTAGTLTVFALGFVEWRGTVPPSGRVVLEQVPVPSGIVVTVTGDRSTLRRRFPATTMLDGEDMETLSRSGLEGLMSLSGGVFVREYGGSIPVVSISIRGSDPAHTSYSVDGHDLASCMDGSPGLVLDPAVFGGMEVSRGSGSRFMSGGMAGTLNFISAAASRPPKVSVDISDDGSGGVSGSVRAGEGRLGFSLRRSVGVRETTGYGASLIYTGKTGPLTGGALASVAGGGTENPDWSIPTDGTRERGSLDCWGRAELGSDLSLIADLRTGRHVFCSTVPESIDDTHDEAGAGFGAELRIRPAGIHAIISAGIEADRVWSTSLGDRGRTALEGSIEAGFLEAVSVNASAAVNHVPGETTLPGAGIMLGAPLLDSMVIAHAGAALGFRRPTLNDLYWPLDSYAVGNPDLEAETSLDTEAGVSLHPARRASISVTAFFGRSRDLIRWEPGAEGIWSPVNRARVARRGVEAEGWASIGSMELLGTLTVLEVRDDDPCSPEFGRTLPYVPDHTWSLKASIALDRKWRVNAGARGMGIRFTNYSETSWQAAYALLQAGIDFRPSLHAGITMELSVDNLLDEEYLETSGFPGRGRTFRAGLRWTGSGS